MNLLKNKISFFVFGELILNKLLFLRQLLIQLYL